jgi:hypothetical protein
MRNVAIFTAIVAASLAAAIVISPIAVSALANFLDLERVLVRKNPSGLDAVFKTDGQIPQNGNGIPPAFGYGLLTSQGGIIVSTTHKGVLDSATQNGNGNNPIFHNHFITLKSISGTGCPSNAIGAVDKITFQSPGQIKIEGADAIQARVPKSFTGTDSFTRASLTLSPGNNVIDAISFSLVPIGVGPGDTTPTNVCVIREDAADRRTELFVR